MPNLGQKPKALSLVRKGSVGSNSDDENNHFRHQTLTSPNSVLHRASSMIEIPRFSFEEKKQRLNDVLFGDKDLTNENVISPVKGRYFSSTHMRKVDLRAFFHEFGMSERNIKINFSSQNGSTLCRKLLFFIFLLNL